MAFSVEDFQDLVQLLETHPEWRAELRRRLLTDDLLELPAIVRRLAEAQERSEQRLGTVEEHMGSLEERMARIEERMARIEEQVLKLAEAQERTEQRLAVLEEHMARLAAAMERTERRLGTLEDQVGDLRGWALERQYTDRAPAYFGSLVRRLRVVGSVQLADLLDDAIARGRVTEAERAAVLQADLVVQGKRVEDQTDVYLVVEISAGIGDHDVERAALRAEILAKLGRPAIPVVAGHRIDPTARSLAVTMGVKPVLDGVSV